jgi:hypothetical protein
MSGGLDASLRGRWVVHALWQGLLTLSPEPTALWQGLLTTAFNILACHNCLR